MPATLGFLLVLLLSIGCKEQPEPKEEIRPVKFGLVEQVGGTKKITYSGVTQSASLTALSFQSGGLLLKLDAKVGQGVKKGQLLAQLDQKDAQLAYDQALVDVKNAKAQYDAASSGFERIKQLYETNNASLSDYEAAKSSYSSAQSAYEISLKRLELQNSKISYTEIKAPMNGVISNVEVKVNEVVQPGRTVITMGRENDNDIEVQVGLPERYINQIKHGDEVNVQIGSIAELFKGVVTEVAFTSSKGGVSYPVTIAVDTKNISSVRPDMPAEVSFNIGSEKSQVQIVVPLKAVASGVDGNYVFVLVPAGQEGLFTAQKAEVELGEITSHGYVIQQGVEAGDRVAVAGLRALYDGRLVKLMNN